MTVFIVENSNGVVLATFKTKRRADNFVKNVGTKLWRERWRVWPMILNEIPGWLKSDYPKEFTR